MDDHRTWPATLLLSRAAHLARARWLSKARRARVRLALGIDVQHDPRDLATVASFRIRIEQAQLGDGMLVVVDGQRGIGGR